MMRRACKGILGIGASTGGVYVATTSAVACVFTVVLSAVMLLVMQYAPPLSRAGRRPLRIARIGGRVKIFRAVDPQHLHELEVANGMAVDEVAQIRADEQKLREAQERTWLHRVNWRARQARPVDLCHRHVSSRLPHGFFGASGSGGATFAASGFTQAPLHAAQQIVGDVQHHLETETRGIVLPAGVTIRPVERPVPRNYYQAWDQAMALHRAGALSKTELLNIPHLPHQ